MYWFWKITSNFRMFYFYLSHAVRSCLTTHKYSMPNAKCIDFIQLEKFELGLIFCVIHFTREESVQISIIKLKEKEGAHQLAFCHEIKNSKFCLE